MIDIPKNILAPTDFSEVSRVAVGYAVKLAAAMHASLHLHHAAQYESEQVGSGAPAGRGSPRSLAPICRAAKSTETD